jgi:hypothetical protein
VTVTTVTCAATADFLEWCAQQLRAGCLHALSIEMPEGQNARATVVMDGLASPPPGCVGIDEDEIETNPGLKKPT